MNRLFVAYKPPQISSNAFLSQIKRKYKVKKAGYSGTLDPFAKGVLIVAFHQYTKLFRFLDKSPKSYRATIWLGVKSLSFDTQNIKEVRLLKPFDYKQIQKVCEELLGEISFYPPQFSAKRIEGKRAYEFAKRGEIAPLKKCKMQVFSYEILHYTHPFLSVELKLSEGAYVRSWCELLAQKLEINATLSSLERLSEGKFFYNDEKSLNVLEYLNLKKNSLKDLSKLENGTKIALEELEIREDGEYFLENEKNFSIIKIENKKVEYILNKVEKC